MNCSATVRISQCITCVALAMLIQSCRVQREQSPATDRAPSYAEAALDIKPEFKIFHESADSSVLFIKLNTTNLLYARHGAEEASAKVLAEIRIKPVTKVDLDLHEKTIRIVDQDKDKVPKELIASTTLAIPAGYSYTLEVQLSDVNRQRRQKEYVLVNKENSFNRQNFIAAAEDIHVPLFTDRIAPRTSYLIATNAAEDGQLYVRYYDREFPLPPPPFVATWSPEKFDYRADSTFVLHLDKQHQASFTAASSGFYHFQADTTVKEGFTLFVADHFYPEISTVEDMVDSFRYLVGGSEYDKVAESDTPKQSLENYWITWTGSKERARKAIEEYYQRVEEANTYFSSHVEGWKSDRGIVYIVYGKPNKVYRTNTVETWVYGEENNPLSITFNFLKVINPFTDNDYLLNREEWYKPSWYRSVNAWRDGRIY